MSNNPLEEIYTMQEAAQLYGLSEGSLRYNIRTGKFQENKDILQNEFRNFRNIYF